MDWNIFWPVFLAIALGIWIVKYKFREILEEHRASYFKGIRRVLDDFLYLEIESKAAVAGSEEAEARELETEGTDHWQAQMDRVRHDHWRTKCRAEFTGDDVRDDLEAYDDELRELKEKWQKCFEMESL